MECRPIPRHNVAMGANQPEYETLLLRRTIEPATMLPEFTGAFYPSADELKLLNEGHPLLLSMLGGWSPMLLTVSETPDGS